MRSTLQQMREFGAVDHEPEPIKFINKRGFDPEQEEAERLAKRRSIKENLARLRLASQRQAELTQQRRQLDQQLDQLAADHEHQLEGVQGALSVIEKRMISDISQGRSTNQDDERQRKELLEQIDQANIELQASLKAVREKIPHVDRQLAEILPTASKFQASQRELWERNVACPKLYREYLVAENRSNWAARRSKGLGDRLEDLNDQLNKHKRWEKQQQGISYDREISRIELLLSDVRDCLSDAQSESSAAAAEVARLRQQIADE